MSASPTTVKAQRAAKPGNRQRRGIKAGPRRYIYCIIDCDKPDSFGPIGIGAGHPEVFAAQHGGIGAVISCTDRERFEISRENTIIHQRVMETVMERGHTVLPVRFDTIAEDKPDGSADAESRILNHVLKERIEEFSGLLATMSTRDELGIKGLWPDMKAVFDDIVNSNQKIRALRDRLLAESSVRPGDRRRARLSPLDGKPKLGQMVKNALDAKKLAAEKELTGHLAGTVVDLRRNKTFGDQMFANLAVLVEKSRLEDLDAAVSAFEAQRHGRVRLKYVGPVPPSNFIELIITWDD